MIIKNRYYKRSRISESEFRQLLRCFAMDFTATDTATLTGYSVQEFSKLENRYVARSRHAHAWARVYVNGV